jgi:hypothetical protein
MHANCCRKTKQNWNNHDGYAGEEPSLGASGNVGVRRPDHTVSVPLA